MPSARRRRPRWRTRPQTRDGDRPYVQVVPQVLIVPAQVLVVPSPQVLVDHQLGFLYAALVVFIVVVIVVVEGLPPVVGRRSRWSDRLGGHPVVDRLEAGRRSRAVQVGSAAGGHRWVNSYSAVGGRSHVGGWTELA